LSVGRGSKKRALLLETIRIEEGAPRHLPWHEERMNRSRRELFGVGEPLVLERILTEIPPTGTWRCRILYREEPERVELLPYERRLPRRFVLAEFEGEYRYKYADRSALEALRATHSGRGEPILVREGLLTDTPVANIALRMGKRWYTPRDPLLPGTTRARLLAEGRLAEADLPPSALETCDELALMNAMIGFAPIENPLYIM
jgi:4-amino-4-deoxychorismate lyase